MDSDSHHEEVHEILSSPPTIRMSVSMRKLLADHAATKKLYAERVQRESAVCNLTVEDAFCDIDDGSPRSWKARKAALLASQSVVSLSSFSGERRIRVCSGFVIRWNSYTSTVKILTSAMLVGSPSGHNCVIPDVRVKVCLPSGSISDGLITLIDFHYNIAVVEVKSDQKLPKEILLRGVSSRGAVLAIGRFYDDGRLMCPRGTISKQASIFVCSELLVSSCKITMAGVGGPLVNYSGDVLGINFCGDNHTPYLSMAVVSRCLEHHRNYGWIRDLLLMQLGYVLVMFSSNVLEKFPQQFRSLVRCYWIYPRNIWRWIIKKPMEIL